MAKLVWSAEQLEEFKKPGGMIQVKSMKGVIFGQKKVKKVTFSHREEAKRALVSHSVKAWSDALEKEVMRSAGQPSSLAGMLLNGDKHPTHYPTPDLPHPGGWVELGKAWSIWKTLSRRER